LSKHPGRNPRLRLAKLADAEAITRLINNAFQVERFFLAADRIDIEEVRSRLARGRFILADEDGAINGCVYVEPNGERAYLGLLSVEPARQLSGMGKFLMDAAEDHCRAAGCRFMDLRLVNVRKELPPFYQKLGYAQTGTAPFPEDKPTLVRCHFLIMSKPL
jgi:N-acetylglutamate synthase-like GNAT family acetyltransferase